MVEKIIVSGFADEIDPQLDVQLKVVKELGMEYICLRAADGKGIAEYTVEEIKESILPRLQDRSMQLHRVYQQEVTLLHTNDAPVYPKFHLSAKQIIHLIKIMVMQGNFLQIAVFVAKNLESIAPHGLPGIKALMFDCHKKPRFLPGPDD